MLKNSIAVIILCIFLISCSDKKYFIPQSIIGEIKADGTLEKSITQSNRNGAVLSNGMVITKDGIFDIKLKDNLIFLNNEDNLFLVSNTDNNTILFLNTEGVILKSFQFDYTPLSATLKNDLLAVVLSNNSLVILDTKVNDELFISKNSIVYAVDSKLASPVFTKDEIVFPTLDGKIVFVNLKSLKITNNISLGGGELFNNITYLNVDNKNIVAINKHKIMTVIGNKDFSKDIDVVDAIFSDNRIYVLSLDGEIIEFDLSLQEINKKKFPFASFSGISVNDSIYTLESKGYLIKINKNNFVDSIYKINIDKYRDNFYTKDVIYYDNKIIKLPK